MIMTEENQEVYPVTFCHYHPENQISHFCKNTECLMPMCAECIQIHSQYHQQNNTFGQFATIQSVWKQCKGQLASTLLQFQNFEQELAFQRQNQDIQQNFASQIQQFKNNVLLKISQTLDTYCDNLSKEHNTEAQAVDLLNDLQTHFSQNFEKLDKMINGLQSDKIFLNIIIQTFQNDLQNQYLKVLNEMKNQIFTLEDLKNQNQIIGIDSQKLDTLMNQILDCFIIKIDGKSNQEQEQIANQVEQVLNPVVFDPQTNVNETQIQENSLIQQQVQQSQDVSILSNASQPQPQFISQANLRYINSNANLAHNFAKQPQSAIKQLHQQPGQMQQSIQSQKGLVTPQQIQSRQNQTPRHLPGHVNPFSQSLYGQQFQQLGNQPLPFPQQQQIQQQQIQQQQLQQQQQQFPGKQQYPQQKQQLQPHLHPTQPMHPGQQFKQGQPLPSTFPAQQPIQQQMKNVQGSLQIAQQGNMKNSYFIKQ